MPTFELNMNLNIRAVTVIGIIQGIVGTPRTGPPGVSRSKNSASPERDAELQDKAPQGEHERVDDGPLQHAAGQAGPRSCAGPRRAWMPCSRSWLSHPASSAECCLQSGTRPATPCRVLRKHEKIPDISGPEGAPQEVLAFHGNRKSAAAGSARFGVRLCPQPLLSICLSDYFPRIP